ncbi:hypothetical protein [Streptomyces griseoviridis]|uniref:DUF4175 domain-containing protein n=1 Tax=Streptomyces griseoviridis TaxID=45398 RepID=A0ABT9LF86_STRGD|nr:hypothetical protein [Streptomyces griseoviridis]MDP9682391.1 hypothetical protein [Streptomyces griseoviridis]GGS81809.1 hypothetical protein GCM10010240_13960 [Streptomyces griseoviridis]
MTPILTALAGTLLILAVLFGLLLRWITPPTAFALCATAAALNLVHALERGAWIWAALDLIAAVAFTWWAARPAPPKARR